MNKDQLKETESPISQDNVGSLFRFSFKTEIAAAFLKFKWREVLTHSERTAKVQGAC